MLIYYGILLFFVLEYVRPGTYIPGIEALHLNSLVPLGTVIGTMASASPVTGADFFKEANTRMFGILLALIVVSVLTAEVTIYSYNVFTMVFGYVLVYWVLSRQIWDLQRIKGMFKTLIAVHLVLAAMTPAMFTDPNTRHYIAAGTFLGDGNDYALSVNLVIPFCLFLFFDADKMFHKIIYAVCLLVLVLCVIATQSRGGSIALLVVGLYYWVKSDRKVMTGSVAAVLLVVGLAFAGPAYFERMSTISTYQSDGSAQGRIQAWQAGTRMALSNPLMGVGAGQFPANFTRFVPGGGETAWKTAHSIYFLILGELGLPGLALLLWFIFGNLWRNRSVMTELNSKPSKTSSKYSQLISSLSAAVIAYAVAGAFLSAVYYPHMFVLAGLLFASRRVAALEARAEASAVDPVAVPARPEMRAVVRARNAMQFKLKARQNP